jgi:hypothetical protein
VVDDESNPENVRVVMAEALGWFDNSVRRNEIISFCQRQLEKDGIPESVSAELTQTLGRLK